MYTYIYIYIYILARPRTREHAFRRTQYKINRGSRTLPNTSVKHPPNTANTGTQPNTRSSPHRNPEHTNTNPNTRSTNTRTPTLLRTRTRTQTRTLPSCPAAAHHLVPIYIYIYIYTYIHAYVYACILHRRTRGFEPTHSSYWRFEHLALTTRPRHPLRKCLILVLCLNCGARSQRI